MTKMGLHSEEFLHAIMQKQLRLSAGIASVFIIIIAVVPILNLFLPDVMNAQFAFGLTLTWFVLGLAIFPVLIALAMVYVRQSNAFEDEVFSMVDASTLPSADVVAPDAIPAPATATGEAPTPTSSEAAQAAH
ncbi:MAG: DUF485 domain-containing protein [Coriobacteriales bacterium]|nr:DUF485 domain-containing protein [Coriobacteriales bacterium]